MKVLPRQGTGPATGLNLILRRMGVELGRYHPSQQIHESVIISQQYNHMSKHQQGQSAAMHSEGNTSTCRRVVKQVPKPIENMPNTLGLGLGLGPTRGLHEIRAVVYYRHQNIR